MRIRWSDLPVMMANPLGRKNLLSGVRYRAFPWYRFRARRHRRTALKNTCTIAVVGSLGKTTAMRAARAALGLSNDGRAGGNQFSNLCRSLLSHPPGSPAMVLEAGIARFGQMKIYADIVRPNITVVTSIASEHNRSLKTLENTRNEKADMVRALPADGIAVLNGDDENVMWMADAAPGRVVTFGLQPGRDVFADTIKINPAGGMDLRLQLFDKSYPVRTRLNGEPALYSLMAGVTAAVLAGAEPQSAIRAMAELPPAVGRLAIWTLPNGAQVLDDSHKSSHETVLSALDTFESLTARRKIIVMGLISETPGPQGQVYGDLGERLAPLAEHIYLVGDMHRRILTGARRYSSETGHFTVLRENDTEALARTLAEQLGPGDLLLLKGRADQNFERILLRLQGQRVRCTIPKCTSKGSCWQCPMLERGWQGRRVVY